MNAKWYWDTAAAEKRWKVREKSIGKSERAETKERKSSLFFNFSTGKLITNCFKPPWRLRSVSDFSGGIMAFLQTVYKF